MENEQLREAVRQHYGQIARQGGSCCGSGQSSCCGGGASAVEAERISGALGYSREELGAVPDGANLGLGCGNPTALAEVREGETVLDLGSGAGFDCFLAARRVGERGRVIGVDMTTEMLEKARANARRGGYTNVEFRLGEIENLPVADATVDLIISNCVINLSVDKGRVFREAFRVLKPGGRLMVSDIVLRGELPQHLQESAAAYAGCIAGALQVEEYLEQMRAAGFRQVQVVQERSFGPELVVEDPLVDSLRRERQITAAEVERLGRTIVSASISAVKP